MTWAGIVFTMVSHATLFIVYVVLCVPNPNDERLTDPGFLVRISRDTSIVFIALSAVSIATDFYVATIPVSAMRNLKMSLGKKIGVSALFAIGLLYVNSHWNLCVWEIALTAFFPGRAFVAWSH